MLLSNQLVFLIGLLIFRTNRRTLPPNTLPHTMDVGGFHGAALVLLLKGLFSLSFKLLLLVLNKGVFHPLRLFFCALRSLPSALYVCEIKCCLVVCLDYGHGWIG